MTRAASLLWVALCCGSAQAAAAAPDAPRVRAVSVDRAFGHVVGDLLHMDVLLEWPSGWELQSDGSASTASGEPAMELRSVSTSPAPERCGGCRRMRFEWQIFKSVRGPQRLDTPALELTFQSQARTAQLRVAPQAISVGPLMAWEAEPGWLRSMRSDLPPRSLDVERPVLHAGAWLLAASVLGAVWLWLSARWLPRSARRPFASAWRQLRALGREGHEAQRVEQALLQLHAAINAHAGEAVLAADLPRFFERSAGLAELAPAVQRMFESSHALFFAAPGPQPSFPELLSLARQLAQAEIGLSREARR